MKEKSERPSIRLDESLLHAIAAHDFNTGPATLTFEARLARENAWTAEFTADAIAQYRRFVYLAAQAGHPVTPSDTVDQVWHLHLCYTRNYWDVLCTQVLRQPLHHGPTQGGQAETAKYTDWYAKTIESYRAHFGEEPPADIWPDPASRFDGPASFKRVDSCTHWVIPKPRFAAGRLAPLVVVPVLLGAAGAMAAFDAPRTQADMNAVTGIYFLSLVMYFFLMATGWRHTALAFSAAVATVLVVFFGQALAGSPVLVVLSLAGWLIVTVLLQALFYRPKRRIGATAANPSSAGDSGCVSYIYGGSTGGSGKSGSRDHSDGHGQSDGSGHGHGHGGDSGHGGGDSGGGDGGGSGCGGGCGGGGD